MRDPRVIPFFDLVPDDTSSFHKLKTAMKGTKFKAVSSIKQTVTRELKAMREEAFSQAFYSLHEQRKR
jgi:hypothetical protein